MANSLVSDCIRTILGDLKLESTSGNILLTAGLSILLSADPTLPLGAATKQYVDAVATGLDVKKSVRVSTNGTLAATRSVNVITATGNGAITIDGVLLSVTDRILVKNGLAAGDNEVEEITDLTCVAKASYTDNTATPADYFDISTHLNTNRYRVYFDFTGAGVVPSADGRVLTQVDISGATSATDVGVILDGVLSGLANLSATNAVGVVTATNTTDGDTEDADGATAVSAAGMTITTTQQGISDNSSNGIYTVTTAGNAGTAYVLTRATDADEDFEVTAGLFTFTEEGTVNKEIGFVLITDDPVTVNFTAQTFSQFSTHGGDVSGPGAGNSTDEALVRWDTTSGKLVQDSVALLTDAGALSGLTQLDVDNIIINGNTINITSVDGTITVVSNGTGQANFGTNGTSHTTVLGSTFGTSTTTIQSGTGNLNLTSEDDMLLDTKGLLELNSSAGPINIGNDDNAFNIDIGTGGSNRTVNLATGTAVYTLTIGSADTTSSTLIQSGTGNVTITPAGVGTIDTTKQLDIQGGVTVATKTINSVTALTLADSGSLITVEQGTGYAITLPNPVIPGTWFRLMYVEGTSGDVTVSNTDGELFGTLIDDSGNTNINAATTLTFDDTVAKTGDSIDIWGYDATTYRILAVADVASAIDIT